MKGEARVLAFGLVRRVQPSNSDLDTFGVIARALPISLPNHCSERVALPLQAVDLTHQCAHALALRPAFLAPEVVKFDLVFVVIVPLALDQPRQCREPRTVRLVILIVTG